MISQFIKSSRAAISVLFALLIGIIIMIFVLVIMESLGLHSQMDEHQCVNSDWEREHMRQLTLDAIDKAFQEHVERLFEIWVKDTSDQPRRAIGGMAINKSAYNRARLHALEWNPPLCKRNPT